MASCSARTASRFATLLPALLLLCALFGSGSLHAQAAGGSAARDLTVRGVNYSDDGPTPFIMYLRGDEMRMDQGNSSMILRLGGQQPGMLFIEHGARRVHFLPSNTAARGESAVSAETVVRYETDPEPLPGLEALAPIPVTVTIVRNGIEEVVPLDLEKVGFHYEGDAKLPGMDGAQVPPEMRDMMKVVMRIESRAAVDPDLPGADVVRAFYRQMSNAGTNASPAGFESMSAGLMAVNREIATVGFPVWSGSVSRVQVEVEGPMAGMMKGMLDRMPGMGNTLAVSVVESLSTDAVDPALFYGGGFPEGYTIETLSGSVGGPRP